jgi:hypothetical protein
MCARCQREEFHAALIGVLIVIGLWEICNYNLYLCSGFLVYPGNMQFGVSMKCLAREARAGMECSLYIGLCYSQVGAL